MTDFEIGGIRLRKSGRKNFEFFSEIFSNLFSASCLELQMNGYLSTYEQKKKLKSLIA